MKYQPALESTKVRCEPVATTMKTNNIPKEPLDCDSNYTAFLRALSNAGGCLTARTLSFGLHAKAFDCFPQNMDAFVELTDGNKLSGTVSDANVAGTEDDSIGAQGDHAGGFGAEGDGA